MAGSSSYTTLISCPGLTVHSSGTITINGNTLSLTSALSAGDIGKLLQVTAANGTTGTINKTAVTFPTSAPSSAGQVLRASSTSAFDYTTYTLPSSAGSSGVFLQSNGTNIVASSFTLPTSAGSSGKVLQSDGTNLVASAFTLPTSAGSSGVFLQSDGTNIVASSFTLPTSAGSSGKILQSNGTNVVLSAFTLPTSIGATGKILFSDGTNYVTSSNTYPNTTAAIGQSLIATSSGALSWTTPITGSGTDNHLTRWNGTGAIQDSNIVVSDGGMLNGVRNININSSDAVQAALGSYSLLASSKITTNNVTTAGGDYNTVFSSFFQVYGGGNTGAGLAFGASANYNTVIGMYNDAFTNPGLVTINGIVNTLIGCYSNNNPSSQCTISGNNNFIVNCDLHSVTQSFSGNNGAFISCFLPDSGSSSYNAVQLASARVVTPASSTYIVCGGYAASGSPSTANRTWQIDSATGAISCKASALAGSTTFSDFAELIPNRDVAVIPYGTIVAESNGLVFPATSADSACGVCSATATYIANAAEFCWHGRYMVDVFGEPVMETVMVPDETWKPGKTQTEADRPTMTVTQQKQNISYNPDLSYTSRINRRSEYTVVAIKGVVAVRVDDTVVPTCYVGAHATTAGLGTHIDTPTTECRLRCMTILQAYDPTLRYAVAKCRLNF